MIFTDDDLQQLKKHLKEVHDDTDDDYSEFPPRKIKALLARLEAAEAMIAYIWDDGKSPDENNVALNALEQTWRKAAGK